MKVGKKIVKVLSNIICTLLLVSMAAGILAFLLGIKPYITMSGSMEPYIHTGSVCFVNSRVPYEEAETGDVIAFETGTGVMVTHRVIGKTAEGLVTRGDANTVQDRALVTRSNFGGKTIFSIPKVGYALAALSKPAGAAMVMVIILAVVLLSFADASGGKRSAKDRSKS